jgi:hypothetical protein
MLFQQQEDSIWLFCTSDCHSTGLFGRQISRCLNPAETHPEAHRNDGGQRKRGKCICLCHANRTSGEQDGFYFRNLVCPPALACMNKTPPYEEDPRETPYDDPRQQNDWPTHKQTDKPWKGNPEKDQLPADRPDIDLEKWQESNTH